MELIKWAVGGESLVTAAYFLLGWIPRNLWAPGNAHISPLQHASMTSRLYDITFKMGGVLQSLRFLRKIELILKEEQELAIEGCFFCMAANGIREEYLLQDAPVSVLQAAHSAGFISKKNKLKTTESCTQVFV